jgi:dual specificity MAP kinase phosphatase
MLRQLKSHLIVLVIFLEKLFDITYRLLVGVPRLKRSQITKDLFLGGQYNLRGLQRLREMGITAIVNLRETSLYEAARYQGLAYLHLPTVDNTPPRLEDLIKGADFVDGQIKNKGKVYIHCRQGLGRGPSMAIAYLLRKGTTFEDAFALVKSVRPFIDPRPAQLARLRELEQHYRKEKASV